MRRASFGNQARVHNGYCYPRSIAMAERSRMNFDAFITDPADAVFGDMKSVYAIARSSTVSGAQVETCLRRDFHDRLARPGFGQSECSFRPSEIPIRQSLVSIQTITRRSSRQTAYSRRDAG
jgi:hypothetical protein